MIRVALATLVLLSAGCSYGDAVHAEEIDLCGYELVFADEFDDAAFGHLELGEGDRWTVHTPWAGDFGDAEFSDPGPNGPFNVSDGILTITASKDQQGKWRSGLIAAADASGAGFGTQYGYFEARMKFPPGPGTWPAFWLMSLQPARQSPKIEVDVVEYYGHNTDNYFATTHVWYADDAEGETTHEGKELGVPDGSLVEDFHRYGVRVTAEHITYYLDGTAMWQQDTPPEHTTPLYPLVNLALGSGYPIDDTPNPSRLEVDYVRVYAAPVAGELPADCTP